MSDEQKALEEKLAAMQEQMAEQQRQVAELERQLAEQAEAGADKPSADRSAAISGNATASPIVTGDGNTLLGAVETLRIESATFLAGPESVQVERKALLQTYLTRVVRATGTLDLSGVDRQTASSQDEAQLELAAVYTALDTLRSEKDEGARGKGRVDELAQLSQFGNERAQQTALAFVNESYYAALLGDPGSGKTTFANFVALCLAGEMLGLESANVARLGEEWTLGTLLPVRVVLRDFAVYVLASGADGGSGGAREAKGSELLWLYLSNQLGQSLAGFGPLLNKHLLEAGGLLILDGLDEVPEANRCREAVKQAVLDFRDAFPLVRILLTSRTYAYQRQEWRLPEFEEAVLAPFGEEQIGAFVEGWYAHMAQVRSGLSAQDAQGRAQLLRQAIDESAHLRELAPRPLLLTLMASLHAWRGGSLPDDREQLYEESVELLLDIWEKPKVALGVDGQPVVQTKSVAAWLEAPQAEVRQALEKLAYEVHAKQGAEAGRATGTADIAEQDLVLALWAIMRAPERSPAEKELSMVHVTEYIRDRAGLLINRGEGIYSFPHRTFQEYLAARYLTRNNFPGHLLALVREEPERWREVLLLAGAKVARGTPFAVWTLVERLCSGPCVVDSTGAGVTTASGAATDSGVPTDREWWCALLAGRLLVETGVYRAMEKEADLVNLQTLERVRQWLAALVAGGRLPPADRAMAGVTLGTLGDLRRGVGLVDGLPDIAWVAVDGGSFVMGSDPQVDELADNDEQPQFSCTLNEQEYRISRYPITVAQYGAFVAAGGYGQRQYWTDAGWAWREAGNVAGPEQYGRSFECANHPQVGVSWFEAVAFCRWLSTMTGVEIRLPSEAEWERAARSTDGRLYPWGKEFDVLHCNMGETGIGKTCAVGSFPTGESSDGCLDMAGNVFEWTRSQYREYPYVVDDGREDLTAGDDVLRTLRGGAFNNNRNLVRCAYRNRGNPRDQDDGVGFRVMSPGS